MLNQFQKIFEIKNEKDYLVNGSGIKLGKQKQRQKEKQNNRGVTINLANLEVLNSQAALCTYYYRIVRKIKQEPFEKENVSLDRKNKQNKVVSQKNRLPKLRSDRIRKIGNYYNILGRNSLNQNVHDNSRIDLKKRTAQIYVALVTGE